VLEVKPGWREGPRLYTAIVADPGSKKSPALALVMQPIREHQQRLQALYQHAGPADHGNDGQQTSHLPPAGDPGEAPPSSQPLMPQMYTTDATMEALIQLLHQHPRGVLFVRDELTAWVLGMNQYRGGKGSDRQHWLSLWNGAEIIVNRKTRKEVTVVPNPFVNVTGCLPPEVLPDLADPHRRADGLLDRILFSLPEAVPLRWTDAGVTEKTMAAYTQVLTALWQLDPERERAAACHAVPVPVTFTLEGRTAFANLMNTLYAQLTDPDLPDHLRGPYAKLEGYAARLALILQESHFAAQEADHEAVDTYSVDGAVGLLRYFQGHARRVYRRFWVTRADQQAHKASQWIQTYGGACTARDLQLHRVAGIGRASEAKKLLRDLVDLGHGSIEVRRLPSGRMQQIFVLHRNASG